MKNSDIKKLALLSMIGIMSVTNSKNVNAEHKPYQNEITYEFVPTITLTTNANIRNGASINSGIVCTLPAGTQIKLLSEYPEWYEVELNGSIYYVSKTCAVVSSYSQVNNNAVKYVTTKDYTNLYQTASYNNYIGVIPPNVTVEVYLEDGEFIFIKYNNQVGFVEKSNLYGYHKNNNYKKDYPKPQKYYDGKWHPRYYNGKWYPGYIVESETYFDSVDIFNYPKQYINPEEQNEFPPVYYDNSDSQGYYRSLQK